jgi:hypothetical protein
MSEFGFTIHNSGAAEFESVNLAAAELAKDVCARLAAFHYRSRHWSPLVRQDTGPFPVVLAFDVI